MVIRRPALPAQRSRTPPLTPSWTMMRSPWASPRTPALRFEPLAAVSFDVPQSSGHLVTISLFPFLTQVDQSPEPGDNSPEPGDEDRPPHATYWSLKHWTESIPGSPCQPSLEGPVNSPGSPPVKSSAASKRYYVPVNVSRRPSSTKWRFWIVPEVSPCSRVCSDMVLMSEKWRVDWSGLQRYYVS